eukprot:TRINITY_DN101626_c0_g1_i1.p1 TRINITY_DN101626_c0_g1~~TRINITY_DN101626_c0_g1_i1.p1  ORF type:complete len:553 (+),score=129.70 TRINITY_DN101626_c0_g1_i1:141-1799(+)
MRSPHQRESTCAMPLRYVLVAAGSLSLAMAVRQGVDEPEAMSATSLLSLRSQRLRAGRATEAEADAGGCSQARSWRACARIPGCGYMSKSNAKATRKLPQYSPLLGSCVPVDIFRVDALEEPSSEAGAIKLTTKEGKRYILVSELCSEDTEWTDAACTNACEAGASAPDCVETPGCVYVTPTSEGVNDNLPPTLEGAVGKCVAANGLKASVKDSRWREGGQGLKATGAEGEKTLHLPTTGDPTCVEGKDASPRAPASHWPAESKQKTHMLDKCRCVFWRTVNSQGAITDIKTNYRFATENPDEYMMVDYGCWRDILHKGLRMPVQFEYIASKDRGNEERADKFDIDETPGLRDWQPPRWASSDKYGDPYDVGHLVMANHFDGSEELIEATNLMTNVVPQHKDMNRFAWLATEMLVECARDRFMENVYTMGGCVWDMEKADYVKDFEKMEPYKILIPHSCWKIIASPKRGHLAFWMPNDSEARISRSKAKDKKGVERGVRQLSAFVVSLSELEERLSTSQTPQNFTIAGADKNDAPDAEEMTQRGWTLSCNMM